jgi:DNA-binding response OmpR family regulator
MTGDITASFCLQAAASRASGARASAAAVQSGALRLLLIETDAVLAREFKQLLEIAGFEVELASGVPEDGAASKHFPVVMIGGGVSADDRAMLLRGLCEHGATPSLVLMASGGAGVDPRRSTRRRDCLATLFQIEAVVARLQSLLGNKPVRFGGAVRFGNVAIDGEGQVTIAGKVTYFQAAEVAILSLLMRRKGKIVPKRSLEASLHGKSDGAAANAVEVRVHRLRKSLATNAADLRVRTIRNAGYCIVRHDPAT